MDELKYLTTSQNRIEILHAMGIMTLLDVIHHFPYRYEEIVECWPGDETGKITVEGTVINAPKVFFKGRFSRLSVSVEIKGEEYQVAIFNRHFLRSQLVVGKVVTIIGKREGFRITASQILLKTIESQKGITPVYSLKEGLTNKSFGGYVHKALSLLEDNLEDFVPEEFKKMHHLIDKKTALYAIHTPHDHNEIITGMKSLKYEEFLKFELTMQFIKTQREQEVGIAKCFDEKDINTWIAQLPYELTKDQKLAVEDLLHDLKEPTMMYRFLQGDVGSGKTVVSSIGLYANYLSGFQGALMAPTEVLAKQHYATLTAFFQRTSIRIVLLVGSLTPKEKEQIYSQIEAGEADIIVGTHALFQEKLNYANLGLVITDEQHRFGVEQRKAFKNKGECVDFLVMSATPIPRTLALSLYGDMDVSTIKTMPQGRKEVITKYFKGSSMKPFLKDLKTYLESGGQCYVICPLIEDNETSTLKSATQIAQAMSRYFKDSYHVGLLHGGLNEEEKDAIMDSFKKNDIQILVSTTVIEVGIDVKNANMMVIYNAERFGMSQIHQLRGRVGRGQTQGYCYLLSSADHAEAVERLEFLETHHDGFEISYYDLQTRGPGEVLGQRQSGALTFMLGDVFKDFNILESARRDALKILEDYYKYDEYKNYIEIIKEKIKSGNEYMD